VIVLPEQQLKYSPHSQTRKANDWEEGHPKFNGLSFDLIRFFCSSNVTDMFVTMEEHGVIRVI